MCAQVICDMKYSINERTPWNQSSLFEQNLVVCLRLLGSQEVKVSLSFGHLSCGHGTRVSAKP